MWDANLSVTNAIASNFKQLHIDRARFCTNTCSMRMKTGHPTRVLLKATRTYTPQVTETVQANNVCKFGRCAVRKDAGRDFHRFWRTRTHRVRLRCVPCRVRTEMHS